MSQQSGHRCGSTAPLLHGGRRVLIRVRPVAGHELVVDAGVLICTFDSEVVERMLACPVARLAPAQKLLRRTVAFTIPRAARTIELSVLTSQCLDRRIPDKATLVREVTAWMHNRNVQQSGIDWRFTTPTHASNSSASSGDPAMTVLYLAGQRRGSRQGDATNSGLPCQSERLVASMGPTSKAETPRMWRSGAPLSLC